MLEYFRKLDTTYQIELKEIVKTQQNFANRKALELSLIYYQKMKEFVKSKGFKNDEEEINYFKNIKPKLQSQVIYFKKIIQIQSNVPIGSVDTKKEFYSSYLLTMTAYHEENKEIIRYYRSFKTNLDINFFIRKNAILHRGLEPELSEVDYDQCTGYDLVIAKFIALEKLERYVRFQLMNIDSLDPQAFLPEDYNFSEQAFVPELVWTETKIALIEVLNIFKAANVFNNGTVDMKTIVAHFEYMLQIDLGDIYKGLNQIKERKKISKTHFIDQITENFKRKLEQDDSL